LPFIEHTSLFGVDMPQTAVHGRGCSACFCSSPICFYTCVVNILAGSILNIPIFTLALNPDIADINIDRLAVNPFQVLLNTYLPLLNHHYLLLNKYHVLLNKGQMVLNG
jgi:hypothetical protein